MDQTDFYLTQYYDKSFLGKMQSNIFLSRLTTIRTKLEKMMFSSRTVLDIGCGPMFVSQVLFELNPRHTSYVGLDLMVSSKIKEYRDAMRQDTGGDITAIRASAQALPFKSNIFSLVTSLDVLEHLPQPANCANEINRVATKDSMIIISLPLENMMQRLLRCGFIFQKLSREPTLKNTSLKDTVLWVFKTPKYHYWGNIKSYKNMAKLLNKLWQNIFTTYTPAGFNESLNINAIAFFERK